MGSKDINDTVMCYNESGNNSMYKVMIRITINSY